MQDEYDKQNLKLCMDYLRGVRTEEGVLSQIQYGYLSLPSEERQMAERWAKNLERAIAIFNKSGLLGKLKIRVK